MRKELKVLAIVLSIPLLIILALVAVVFSQYRRNDRPISVPVARGPHPVGRVIADWKDAVRKRELMVFLWYPAKNGATGPHAEYLPGKWGELAARGMIPIPANRLRELRVNALESPPLADGELPVLILLPGMGRNPADYTTLAEDLASYGYLVAGVTPTGSARPVVFPDGRVVQGVELDPEDLVRSERVIETWIADASFALGQMGRDARFAAHVGSRIGIFGHSFGGNAAVRTLGKDARFQRAADLDGAFFGEPIENLDKPVLILESGSGGEPIDRTVCNRDKAGCEVRTFPKAKHMDFSDAAILPSRFPIPKSELQLGDIDGAEFLRGVSDQLRTFFGNP